MKTEDARVGLQFRDICRCRFIRASFTVFDGGGQHRNPGITPSITADRISDNSFISTRLVSTNSVFVFVDAAFSEVRCTYGLIMLDATGGFIYARSGRCQASSALHAELMAILEGLTLIAQTCYTMTTIYTDSMLAMPYLHSDSSSWPWNLAFTIHCCKHLWHKDTTPIEHTPRAYNMLAHTLAQTTDLSSAFTEYNTIPASIQDFF